MMNPFGAFNGILASGVNGVLGGIPSAANVLNSSGGVNTGASNVAPNSISFAFEHMAAILTPFDFNLLQGRRDTGMSGAPSGGPLSPIYQTMGLVFPYNPTISEGVSVKYQNIELTHSNESYYAFNSTDNVRITLGECVWTCDTFENAVYTLAVLHFLRSYSWMDFGRDRSGRPPSPMWFSAYGNYAFYRVPVLLEKADWSFPNDIDYVGIPEPGTANYTNRQLETATTNPGVGTGFTWLPIKFMVSSISLIVQHPPSYWINWSLDDYRSGAMLERDGSFHEVGTP